jgi:hypothetical protein
MLERPRKSRHARPKAETFDNNIGDIQGLKAPTGTSRAAATARATARQRTYRRRQRDGVTPVTIECDSSIVSMMVAIGWLAEADSGDKAAIARAIERMLADTAEKYR